MKLISLGQQRVEATGAELRKLFRLSEMWALTDAKVVTDARTGEKSVAIVFQHFVDKTFVSVDALRDGEDAAP